jgi:hypothetical protein
VERTLIARWLAGDSKTAALLILYRGSLRMRIPRWVGRGNKISTPPCRGVKIAQFKDPDGNRIGIMKSPAM